MEHQSLYRKYRSQCFEEIAGQQHVTRTLQNALSTGRVSHAYLFCGPRGTGKTSTARLLAKALNCEKGPTPTPCNQCDLCLGISTGRAMDVVEVDAASETGIDNVREVIINNSRYAPAEGRYKIYIIDEVHDLSRAAFDSLLKTLEEPPPHVVFVLATTEIHKVPATIISRCQRFEFRRGSLDEVRSRVEYVARQEGINLEPAAAVLIARASQGGWRDALSLLEQVISYADQEVTARDVGIVLGSIEDEDLADLTQQITAREALASLKKLDDLLAEGKDIRQLLHNFSDYLRDCLLHTMGASGLTDRPLVPMDSRQGMLLLELTARAERELRWNTQHRLVLELMILRMTAPAGAPALEEKMETANRAPARVQPSPVKSTSAPAPSGLPAAPISPAVPISPAAPISPGALLLPAAPLVGVPQTTPDPVSPHPVSPDLVPSSLVPPAANIVESTAARVSTGLPPERSPAPGPEFNPFSMTPAETRVAAVEASASPPVAASTLTLATVQAQWKPLITRIRSKSRMLATLLAGAEPTALMDGTLTLEFKQQYHCQGIEEISARRAVEGHLSQMMGEPLRIACKLNQETPSRPRGRGSRKEVQPVTDSDLGELFPGWDIKEG